MTGLFLISFWGCRFPDPDGRFNPDPGGITPLSPPDMIRGFFPWGVDQISTGIVPGGSRFIPLGGGAKIKILTPIQKMSSSQSCSHRNSVQNAPVESSTALTATLFVKIPKFGHNPKKSHHHKVVRTEILCRMHRSRAPQLSRRPFS